MYQFPIKHYEENLIFNHNNECWATFKMTGFNYDYKSNEKKVQILNRLARFIAAVGYEAKILIIPVSQDINKHFENLIENKIDKDDVLYEKAQAHAMGTADYLKQKMKIDGNSNDYVTYVITKLKLNEDENVIRDIKQAFDYFIKSPIETIKEFFSLDTSDILESELERFKKLAYEYLKEQNKRIAIQEVTSMDLQWLYRRMSFRGTSKEIKLKTNLKNVTENVDVKKKDNYIEVPWTPFAQQIIKRGERAIRPLEKDVLNLCEGEIDINEKRCLKVIHGNGEVSYQGFLCIPHIPDGIEFPGNEWLLLLQDYPLQTEICIHINTVEHKESIRNIDKKKREINSQIEHINDNSEDIPDELADSKQYADLLESELKASKYPMSRVSITLCFAGATLEDMESKLNFIKEIYEDYNFVLERPVSNQLKLFMEFIPGAGRYVTDYIQPLPPRTLAGGMLGATRLLGDNVGPYIGTTGVLKKNVYLDLGRACLLDNSASASFIGPLGAGKSFNANLVLYLIALYGGCALIFDPKGERSHWEESLPEFKGLINTVTLSTNEEDRGKLDPFLLYRDNLEEAGELALNIVSELFKLNPKDDEYTALLESLSEVKKDKKPCMNKLSDILMGFDENDELAKPARMIGRKIKLIKQAGMAKLLFGTGDEEAINLSNRINIIQIQNLKMPPHQKKKEDYTQEETLSTVMMLPLASFAKKFAFTMRNTFKTILFDESWMLAKTSMGVDLYDFLSRMGRSLFAGCIFIGHSVSDIPGDGIKNAITYRFCFRATDLSEIKRVLEFLDLEETDENIEEIKNLKNGECLFRDLEGRVGKLKFDAVYEHIIKTFKTTPTTKKDEDTESLEGEILEGA